MPLSEKLVNVGGHAVCVWYGVQIIKEGEGEIYSLAPSETNTLPRRLGGFIAWPWKLGSIAFGISGGIVGSNSWPSRKLASSVAVIHRQYTLHTTN